MKLDENMKQQLDAQTRELDALMEDKLSLSEYLRTGFSSGMGWMMKAGYIFGVLFSLLLIFCGYRFFTAVPEQEIFWGVCLILSFQAQVATKLWIYMQTNRAYLSRELRLLALNKR